MGFVEVIHGDGARPQDSPLISIPADVPSAEMVRCGRVDVAVREFGADGPALMFIHGIGNSSRLWLPYAQRLATEHRCLVIDLPGFGASRATAADMQIDRITDILLELLQRRGIDGSAIAVGHSMGALVGAHIAATAPDALRGAVCVSGPPLTALASYRNLASALIRSPKETMSLLSLVSLGALPFSEGLMAWAIGHRPLRKLLLGRFLARLDVLDTDLARFMFGDLGNGRVLAAARNGFGYAYEALYPGTTLAPHVVVGDADPIMSLGDGRKYLELVGAGTLHVLERCGHLPMVERPATLTEVVRAATA